MRHLTEALLTLLALLLALWLIWGFWPLGTGGRFFLSAVSVLLAACWSWRFWRGLRREPAYLNDDALPPEHFAGAVVLTCGDSDALFPDGCDFRETRQGWYIAVRQPELLASMTDTIASARPALVSQLSVMLAVMPERWQDDEAFGSRLRQWRRAISQCRHALSGVPPLWCSVWLNAALRQPDAEHRWYLLTDNRTGIQVQESTGVAQDYRAWCGEAEDVARASRLGDSLWLQGVFSWLQLSVLRPLRERHHDTSALPPGMLAVCCAPVASVADNLWQQRIAAIATLTPDCSVGQTEPLPLPDMLLSRLPHRHGVSRQMRYWRRAGGLVGLFLLAAMLASYLNNQRLIQSVRDHLALYQHLTGTPPAPKLQAQDQLRRDDALLDRWQREGAPMRYALGLYQGGRLAAPVRASMNDWAPPPPPAPVIKQVVQGPKTLRLDSMSLFDSGKAELKAGSTKMLVNSLVDIKAKPGWLIVVSGHTDNTGKATLNQRLSLQRAEAVRNWMRDTGDVPESCFAVQGYGASRPVADNDTSQGRALNRRVEISLVPQADACRLPDATPPSSLEGDGVDNNEWRK